MKHLLMHPGFPDIVGECAFTELADPLFLVMARREIAATRLW